VADCETVLRLVMFRTSANRTLSGATMKSLRTMLYAPPCCCRGVQAIADLRLDFGISVQSKP
jgi:hypothetical protein